MQHVWSRKSIQHKWTLKSALELHSMDIQKMKLPERAELAQFLYNAVSNRVRSYSRAKNYSHPYAYEKMQQDFKELMEDEGYNFDFNKPIVQSFGKNRALTKEYAELDNPAARIISYITQARNFLNAKSSTVSGWRDIIRNESIKLFGYKVIHSKKGDYIRPNYLMTEDERTALWKLYRELVDSGAIAVSEYASESMKTTGFTRIWREGMKENVWRYDDLTFNLNLMKEAMKLGGIPVRDIPEHKPGLKKDPLARDAASEDDSDVEFQW